MTIANWIKAAALGAVLFAAPMAAVADDLDTRFAKISVGETREGAVAIMGRRPDGELRATTLGIDHAQLRWNGGAHVLVIVLVLDRVVSTRDCSDATSC